MPQVSVGTDRSALPFSLSYPSPWVQDPLLHVNPDNQDLQSDLLLLHPFSSFKNYLSAANLTQFNKITEYCCKTHDLHLPACRSREDHDSGYTTSHQQFERCNCLPSNQLFNCFFIKICQRPSIKVSLHRQIVSISFPLARGFVTPKSL